MFGTSGPVLALPPEMTVLRLFEVTRALGSLLSSALLVVLYWRMYRVQRGQRLIQRSQADILDRQSKIMAASYTPDVVVEAVTAHGDRIDVRVTNQGRGRAKNFRVCCQPYVSDGEGGYSLAWESPVPLEPVTSPLARRDGTEVDDGESYRGVVELGLRDAPGSNPSFSEVMGRVAARGTERALGIELYLVYDSEIGERFVQRLDCVNDFEFGPAVTLEEALRTRSSDDPMIDAVSYDDLTAENST